MKKLSTIKLSSTPHVIKYCIFLLLLSANAYTSESLDYTTEHLFEAQMNAQFHLLPDVETNYESSISRVKMGVAHFDAGPSISSDFLIGIQKSFSHNETRSTILKLFYDINFIKTNREIASAQVLQNVAEVMLSEKSSTAQVYGFSISEAYRFNSLFAIQVGTMGEIYKVSNFKLPFTTLNQAVNYSGVINYDHIYYLITPFVTMDYFLPAPVLSMNASARFIVAYPMPRKDLARTVQSGNTMVNLESTSKHIPDGFVGLGFSFESPEKKWRTDIGATFEYYLLEGNVRHKGIKNPVFVNYSFVI